MRKPATWKSTHSAKARSFAVDAAALMAELKCSDVIVIDLEGRSEVCDFVVIGSGTSQRQMRSVGEAIDKMGKERGSPVWRSDADSGASWIVFDFVDVVVHLFEPGQRAFYDLEGIWSDAERVAWRAAPAAASATRSRRAVRSWLARIGVIALVAATASVRAAAAEREVVIDGPAGKLAGTLAVPDGALGPVCAVVFVTGGGLQDRDESIFGHKPFKQIADALCAAGIASLRCDDRGFGKSTGDPSQATTDDFALDARAQLAWMRAQPEIDGARVGVIGHSEGGLIGALLAGSAEGGIEFAVLMAPPGLKGRDILTSQSEDMYRAARSDPMLSAFAVERHRELMDAVEQQAGEAAIDEALRALIAAQLELASKKEPSEELVRVQANLARPGLASAWMQRFIALDPAPSFSALRVPTLLLFGAQDTQVKPDRNLPAITRAAATAPVKPEVVVYPGLNHLFQKCSSGLPDEYARIKSGIESEVIQKIVDWVKARSASSASSR